MGMCVYCICPSGTCWREPELMPWEQWELQMDPKDLQQGSSEHSPAGQPLTPSVTDSVPRTIINAEVSKINRTAPCLQAAQSLDGGRKTTLRGDCCRGGKCSCSGSTTGASLAQAEGGRRKARLGTEGKRQTRRGGCGGEEEAASRILPGFLGGSLQSTGQTREKTICRKRQSFRSAKCETVTDIPGSCPVSKV